MNRADRRKMKKHVKGGNVVMNKGVEKFDHAASQYCWRHKLNLENEDHPTDRDKKLIESIRLKPFKTVDKNGHTTLGRSCPRCGNSIIATSSLQNTEKSSILNTEKEYDNVYLPNLRK